MFVWNQKGSILVVVLVVLFSLTIMGVALGSQVITDQKQTVRQQKNNEAYYLARSGAETVATLLLENQEDIDNYIGQNTQSELGNGRFEVQVVQQDSDTLIIESTGYSGNYSEKVTLSLLTDSAGGSQLPVFDLALFVDGEITFSGSAAVDGNVGTNITTTNGVVIEGGGSSNILGNFYSGVGSDPNDVLSIPGYKDYAIQGEIGTLNEERDYPPPKYPDFPTLPTKPDIKTNWDNASPLITEDGYYDTITIDQNYEVRIDVGDEDTIRRVRVRNFDGVQGRLLLEGEGKLELYVDESFYIKGYFNGGRDWGNPDQAIIYYNSTDDFTLAGETHVYASLFAMYDDYENAKVQVTNGANLYGSMFTNAADVSVNGGSDNNHVRVFYAPNADFELANAGTIYGAVVCNTFQGSGNVDVVYHPDVEDIWDSLPDIGFEDDGDSESSGFIRGNWSN